MTASDAMNATILALYTGEKNNKQNINIKHNTTQTNKQHQRNKIMKDSNINQIFFFFNFLFSENQKCQ